MSAVSDLKQQLGIVSDLHAATAVLEWDQETYMPPGSIEARAEQLTTLARLSHEKFTGEAIGRLLEAAARELGDAPFDAQHPDFGGDAPSLVRVAPDLRTPPRSDSKHGNRPAKRLISLSLKAISKRSLNWPVKKRRC